MTIKRRLHPFNIHASLRNLYVTLGHVHARARASARGSVRVCSLVLFSVVSLIMRKLFNVCLPVEKEEGGGCETVIDRKSVV